jgi:hypothetical protein
VWPRPGPPSNWPGTVGCGFAPADGRPCPGRCRLVSSHPPERPSRRSLPCLPASAKNAPHADWARWRSGARRGGCSHPDEPRAMIRRPGYMRSKTTTNPENKSMLRGGAVHRAPRGPSAPFIRPGRWQGGDWNSEPGTLSCCEKVEPDTLSKLPHLASLGADAYGPHDDEPGSLLAPPEQSDRMSLVEVRQNRIEDPKR